MNKDYFSVFFTLIVGRWGRRLTEATIPLFKLQKAMLFAGGFGDG